MDATSRRICLTGVLKMNSSRFLFLHSPSSLFSFIRAHSFVAPSPLVHARRNEWTNRHGACKRYRSTLPTRIVPMRKQEEIFLNVQRPHSFVSVSRFPSSSHLFPSFPPEERLERKLERLRGKMAPRDGNCYLHPLILK